MSSPASPAWSLAEEAADLLKTGLKADRVALFRWQRGQLSLLATAGVLCFPLDQAPISMALVERLAAIDSNLLLNNASSDLETRNDPALRRSGAVSVLCLPFHDRNGYLVGMFYADTQRRPRAFARKELLFARECARWLGCSEEKGDNSPRPVPPHPAKAAVQQVAAVPARTGERPAQDFHADPQEVTIFFRSLATMMAAGLMIHESLRLLARTAKDRRFSEVLEALSQTVTRGRPLSTALDAFPRAFPGYTRSAIKVGERSGRLAYILEILASDLEKSRKLILRVRSALLYPAFLAVACALMLGLGLPFMLRGHLEMLSGSGVPLPWLTHALARVCQAVSSPLSYGLAVGLLGALYAYLRTPAGAHRGRAWLLRVPKLGSALRTLALARFTRSLSLQLRSGLSAVEALLGCR